MVSKKLFFFSSLIKDEWQTIRTEEIKQIKKFVKIVIVAPKFQIHRTCSDANILHNTILNIF